MLARMAELDLPLLVHGEVTAREVDVFERETRFIAEVLAPTISRHPKLRVVFEHITTRAAVDFVKGSRARVSPPPSRPSTSCTTATPSSKAAFAHTTTACRSSRPSPIAPHSSTPPPAAIRVSSWAPTARRTRSTPRRMPAAAPACFPRTPASSCTRKSSKRRANSTALEGFASDFGADFYRLPRNTDRIRLVKRAWSPPANYPSHGWADDRLVPMRAGETIAWQLVQ